MSSLIIRDVYNGGYTHGPILRAQVNEGFSKHQIAILDYQVPRNLLQAPPEATPMQFQWGRGPFGLHQFYGYTTHHEVVDSVTEDQVFLRQMCVGMSKTLNTPSPTSWKNVTGSYIARQVAAKHGLRALVHNSKTILPYWTPGQDSDFAMLNRLADHEGYSFWVDGATLYFVDPTVLLTSPARALASTYTFDRTPYDTLYGVRAIDGSLAPGNGAPVSQTVYGINDDSQKLIKASSLQQTNQRGLTAPGNSRVYPKSVSTLAEAHRVNDIAATSGNWTSIQAQTVSDGKAYVGSLVNLDGNALTNEYKGTWMVSDIIHVLAPRPQTRQFAYSAQLQLVRNQKNTNYFETFTTVKDALSEVSAVLRKGQWQASILGAVYV